MADDDDLLRVTAVVDPPVGDQRLAQARGQPLGRLAGDQREVHTGQARRAVDEADGRVEQPRGDEDGEAHAGILIDVASARAKARPPPQQRAPGEIDPLCIAARAARNRGGRQRKLRLHAGSSAMAEARPA